MMPNTAVAFMLIGIALLSASIKPGSRILRLAAGGSAAVTASAGLTTGLEYLLGLNFGIDQWVFHEPRAGPLDPRPHRHQYSRRFPSASLFFLVGARTRHEALSDGCTLGAMLPAFMAFLGYLYQAQFLYGVGQYTPMALHTALTLLLVCAGTLALHPGRGIMGVLTSDQPGGYMLRRLLPVVLLVLPVLGWIRLYGGPRFYGAAMGVAILPRSHRYASRNTAGSPVGQRGGPARR
jgi:hypothetical protein